jgi:hypothetical protein
VPVPALATTPTGRSQRADSRRAGPSPTDRARASQAGSFLGAASESLMLGRHRPESYAPKTIQALLPMATNSVKVWQQTGLRLSWNVTAEVASPRSPPSIPPLLRSFRAGDPSRAGSEATVAPKLLDGGALRQHGLGGGRRPSSPTRSSRRSSGASPSRHPGLEQRQELAAQRAGTRTVGGHHRLD